jgi:hypothetical protein
MSTTKKVKRTVLISMFSVFFTFGIIGTASARPMFGSDEDCNESTCETLGYKTCIKTTYVFWIGLKSEPSPQPC